MLSWASKDSGQNVDLTSLARNGDGIDIEHAELLLRFATACAERDDKDLDLRRSELADATSEAFMVDAAAVAANFEMMTRLADGTGARVSAEAIEQRAAVIGAMGVGELVSKR